MNGPQAALSRQMVWAVHYTSVVLLFKKVVTVMRAVGEGAERHEEAQRTCTCAPLGREPLGWERLKFL